MAGCHDRAKTSVALKLDLWWIESGSALCHVCFHKRSRKVLDHGTTETTMLTTSKIALSVALVLATASAAVAAPKHAVRHQTAVERQVPANPWLSFGSVRPANSANEPTYMNNEDSRECFDGESYRRAAALGGKAYRDRPRLPPDGDGHRGRVC